MEINEFLKCSRTLKPLDNITPRQEMYNDLKWFLDVYFEDCIDESIEYPILKIINSTKVSSQLAYFKNNFYLIFDEKLSIFIRDSYFAIIYGKYSVYSDGLFELASLLLNNKGESIVALKVIRYRECYLNNRVNYDEITNLFNNQNSYIHRNNIKFANHNIINNSLLVTETFILFHELFHFIFNSDKFKNKEDLKAEVKLFLEECQIIKPQSTEEFFCDYWAMNLTFDFFKHSVDNKDLIHTISLVTKSLFLYKFINDKIENIDIDLSNELYNELKNRNEMSSALGKQIYLKSHILNKGLDYEFFTQTQIKINKNFISTIKLTDYFTDSVKQLNQQVNKKFISQKIKFPEKLVELYNGFNPNIEQNQLIEFEIDKKIIQLIDRSIDFNLYLALHSFDKGFLKTVTNIGS